jgi:5-methylcytosine-specific restriction endonuclease McrA
MTSEELKIKKHLAYIKYRESGKWALGNRMRQRRWYNKNKSTDKYKQRKRKLTTAYVDQHTFYRLLHRMKPANKAISRFDLWRIAKRQKLICPLSGRKLDNSSISIDHILPVSKGGNSSLENLRFVHVDVNFAKRALLDNDFIKLCHDIARTQKNPAFSGGACSRLTY